MIALDYLGQTPWRINNFILDVAKEIWATGGNVASIPTRIDLKMMSEDEFYEKIGFWTNDAPLNRTLSYRRIRTTIQN